MPDTFAWWDEPVRVFVNGSTVVAVTRLGKAVELLLTDWPVNGPAYLEARKAALKAFSAPKDAVVQDRARTAFEEAAREAGILAETTH